MHIFCISVSFLLKLPVEVSHGKIGCALKQTYRDMTEMKKQREQSQACLSSAESRLNKSKNSI